MLDLGPIAEVSLEAPEHGEDSPLGPAQLLPVELAREHVVISRAGRFTDRGDIDRVLAHLVNQLSRGIPDRTAREQPHRTGRERGGAAIGELPGRLPPVPRVDGAAEHDRVVPINAVDVVDGNHRDVEAPFAPPIDCASPL